MSKDNWDAIFKDARLKDVALDQNQKVVRNILLKAVVQERSYKKRVLRVAVLMGGAAFLALVTVGILMPKDTGTRPVANNLGAMWCTCNDDGGSTVWPPVSTANQNNFVKSAPGYGERGYAIRFKGEAGKEDQIGTVGVSALLGPHCKGHTCDGVNIKNYDRLRFKIKGNLFGSELVLSIAKGDRGVPLNVSACIAPDSPGGYEVDLTKYVEPKWNTVTLNLHSDFNAPAGSEENHFTLDDVLSNARLVKWYVRNGRGTQVDVWIDEFEFL